MSEADVRTVTYYDDYGFTSYTYGGNKVDEPIGQTTGSRTRVLGSNEWLVSVVYYDHRYPSGVYPDREPPGRHRPGDPYL